MEDDIESSNAASMVPLALALLAIVLGGAGLYFSLNANQRIAPLADSMDESSGSAARLDKQLSSLETRLVEVTAQNDELKSTVERLRLYGSQSEQLVKQVAAGVQSNRSELVTLAEKMKELATLGVRPAPAPAPTTVTTTDFAASSSEDEPAPAASNSAASTYKIQSGDNFGKIAAEKGVSLNALLDANPNADPRRLAIGQVINIPAQ